VHIAVPPAQQGVSRFGEHAAPHEGRFTYSKIEKWTNDITADSFDFLVTGEDGPELYPNHMIGTTSTGFNGLKLTMSWPFVQVQQAPKCYIMQPYPSDEKLLPIEVTSRNQK
jgi:hypothetical protein